MRYGNENPRYTKEDILAEIDLAFNDIPSSNFPKGKEADIYHPKMELFYNYSRFLNKK